MTRLNRLKIVALLCLGLLPVSVMAASESAAPDIRIDVDTEFVTRLHAMFEAEAITDADLDAIAQTAGAQALILKVRQYAAQADAELLKKAIRHAVTGERWEEDPFYLWHSYGQREKTRELLATLNGEMDLSERVGARLAPYLPEEFELETRIVFVLGGASAGWTMGDGAFQVGLDHHASDPVEMIEITAAHEIYHVAQEKMIPQHDGDAENPADRVDALLAALVREGTASLLDDFSDLKEEGKLLAYTRDKQKKNRARITTAFVLFETLVFRTANDPEANLGQLYEIGFLDPWGSSAYEVGKVMAETIVDTDGKKKIPELLQAGPRAFVQRYIEISSKSDSSPRFSSSFAELVGSRAEKN